MPRHFHKALVLCTAIAASTAVYFFVDRLVGLICALLSFATTATLWVRTKRRVPTFELEIEPEGKVLIFVTLGLGFGALNTGSNFLYLILGMLLSLIVVSGVLSQVVLSKLSAVFILPESMPAKTANLCTLRLHNHKTWFPSLNLSFALEQNSRCSTSRHFIESITPLRYEEAILRMTCERRGALNLRDLRLLVSTRFPFGLFVKTRRLRLNGQTLVLPHPLNADLFDAKPNMSDAAYAKRAEEKSFYGLRSFIEGDDLKRVIWKRSTATDELLVRDEVHNQSDTIHLDLIRSITADAYNPVEEFWISGVAYLLQELHRKGYDIVLGLGDVSHSLTASDRNINPILEALAMLDTKTLPKTPKAAQPSLYVVDLSQSISNVTASESTL